MRLFPPDTIPDVIHDAAHRPSGRRRSGIVDNSAKRSSRIVTKLSTFALPKAQKVKVAVPENRPSVCAALQPRSFPPKPSRLKKRSPACDEVPAQTSER